jgi:hypothetical protein
MIRNKEPIWTNDPAVFTEQVACALAYLAQRGEYGMWLSGHAEEPMNVQGNTLLRCRVSFNRLFTDMDGEFRKGYEYRVQNTEEGAVTPDAAKTLLENICASLAARLTAIEPQVYGLPSQPTAQKLGTGLGLWLYCPSPPR